MSRSAVAVDPRSRTGLVRVGRPRTWLVVGIVFVCCPPAVPASAQSIVANDFEDGTLQGWTPRGGTVVLTSTRRGRARGRALAEDDRPHRRLPRAEPQHAGPAHQGRDLPGLGVGAARRGGRDPADRSASPCSGRSRARTTSTPSPRTRTVTAAGWTQLTGLYAFAGNDPSGLLLYVESTNATTAYYIDDFRIDKIADPPGPPPNTNGLVTTFESGTDGGLDVAHRSGDGRRLDRRRAYAAATACSPRTGRRPSAARTSTSPT